mmetsp:Transcript_29159/g.84786  ORF Transcript_29159/g.84786 Transcript_29159/m.84786 type:complete len:222 (-) Transcript_29159:2817-3482(-)
MNKTQSVGLVPSTFSITWVLGGSVSRQSELPRMAILRRPPGRPSVATTSSGRRSMQRPLPCVGRLRRCCSRRRPPAIGRCRGRAGRCPGTLLRIGPPWHRTWCPSRPSGLLSTVPCSGTHRSCAGCRGLPSCRRGSRRRRCRRRRSGGLRGRRTCRPGSRLRTGCRRRRRSGLGLPSCLDASFRRSAIHWNRCTPRVRRTGRCAIRLRRCCQRRSGRFLGR